MCNFTKQDEDTKALMAILMQKFAATVGGANFMLGLIEKMKENRPNPLMNRECKISSNNTIIKWNKKVFKDKIDVLEQIIIAHKSKEGTDFNILDIENQKKKKLIMNMVKTLAPIEFFVTPQNPNDGGGFEFKIFQEIDFEKEVVILNPIFLAMFFCSIEYTKKALKYDI